MRPHKPLWLVIALILLAGAARATDTAFWKPYAPDKNTWLLLHFDKPADVAGQGAFEPRGRFGGALRLDGKGAVKLSPAKILSGGFISIEAWIKLERAPKKTAFILCRPAVVDRSPRYDPEVDRTKGFALFIDADLAFHLRTTNCYYGRPTATSSPKAAVPVGRWVHLAAVSTTFPVMKRRLYVDGVLVAEKAVEWGQGLVVYKDEERAPGPLYIGNDEKGGAGLVGLIDEVRVDTNVFKFWPKADVSWTTATAEREIPTGPPFFLPGHQPVAYLPLDGDGRSAPGGLKDLKVSVERAEWADGVCGRGCLGKIVVSARDLMKIDEGSIEFWMQPVGVNNISDRNVGFFGSNAFSIYIFNGGRGTDGRPLALYFYKKGGGVHFVMANEDIYPGRWFHVVATWHGSEIRLFIDGRKKGETISTGLGMSKSVNGSACNSLGFNTYASPAVIDEVYVYHAALSEAEVANCYWRYRDPRKLRRDVKFHALRLFGWYFPSARRLYYRFSPYAAADRIGEVTLTLRGAQGKVLLEKTVPFTDAERRLDVPELPDGDYTLESKAFLDAERWVDGTSFAFQRRHFAWENNRLGITDDVPAPFTPVRVEGARVEVVARTYEMNGAGLFDKVVTKGRDILAAPMTLKCRVGDKVLTLVPAAPRLERASANAAVWSGGASAGPVAVRTRSTVEYDGCAKVEMTLLPGAQPAEIQRLWLEIPLKSAEAPLFHEVTDGPRINYSGRLPTGRGIVWDSAKARRYGIWQNTFVPYLWLGAEERGLAWFGENDKGWITGKGGSQAPIQEIAREGDRVVLRVYLVNMPATIAAPRALVFGLQASPTKPMPVDWRRKLPDMPGGLAVVPWGGLSCAYQGPLNDDWRIVDKILEARHGKPMPRAWFEAYAREHNPPPANGTWPWLSSVNHFAGRNAAVGLDHPIAVYQEEMAACSIRPEWPTFKSEWTGSPFEDTHRITFAPSYRDFGCHFANEWLKRGVSLYWDNTYPHASFNYRTSAAYRTGDGRIQPCLIIWNQREYHKRVYNLLAAWRKKRPEPLEWTLHMTNTLLLPIHTFGTVDLDHELARHEPFRPDWIRTETIGLQVGNYPLTLYPLYGSKNQRVESLPEPRRTRIEWGMRAVHEIQRSGPLEKLLTDFGYGTDKVVVHHYWSERPVLRVDSPDVKWILLARPADKQILIVFSSWSEKAVSTRFALDPKSLGFAPALVDAESSALLEGEHDRFRLDLAAPYGVRVVKGRGE